MARRVKSLLLRQLRLTRLQWIVAPHVSRRPIAADAPGSGRSAPWSFAVARWGDASGIDPHSPGSETPAGRALSGRSLARSAWWAQVYAARGEPRMRQYDGWISKVGARRGGGAPRTGNQSGMREMKYGLQRA